jgi:hypothetical protein
VVIAVAGTGGPAAASLAWPALAPGAAVHLFGGFPAGSVLRLHGGTLLDAAAVRLKAERLHVAGPSGHPVVVCGTRGGQHRDFLDARQLCTGPQPSLDMSCLVSHVISLSTLTGVAAELATSGTVGGTRALRTVIDLRRHDSYLAQVTARPPALADERSL